MHRRTYVSLIAIAGICSAGCISDKSEEVKSFSLTAENVDADSPDASLKIVYAATVTQELPTDPPTLADDGMKWLLVRMRVKNTGTDEYDINGGPFIVYVDGEVYEIVFTKQEWGLPSRTVQSGASTTGWMVFKIPVGVTEAKLTVRDDISRKFSITFMSDSSLDTALPDG